MRKYLNYSETQRANAIEEIFCSQLDKFQKHPMEELDSKVFLFLLLGQKTDIEGMYKDLGKQCFYLPVLKSRMELLGYTVDMKTEIMIAVICGSVGANVMYAYYL